MNIKRAIGFGIMFWVLAFVVISILMFSPWFKDGEMRQNITWWILEIPITLLLAKWYFKKVTPTAKNGLVLGVLGLITGSILDAAITVPLFVKSYSLFFGNWLMYVGYGIVLLLCIYAGYEFDATFTKPTESVEEK